MAMETQRPRMDAFWHETLTYNSRYGLLLPQKRARVVSQEGVAISPLPESLVEFMHTYGRLEKDPLTEETEISQADAAKMVPNLIEQQLNEGELVVVEVGARGEVYGFQKDVGIAVLMVQRVGEEVHRTHQPSRIELTFGERDEVRLDVGGIAITSGGNILPKMFTVMTSQGILFARRDWMGSPACSYEYLHRQRTAWVANTGLGKH